uniref:Complexin-3-like n=1 Tax=Sinocyclocheilus anshuiensis TaxID=1608454 RepID=A0A671MW95_9TELE
MESVLKTSLLAPIKTLKFCVSGEKQRSKRGSKWPGSKGRTGAPDPHLLRSYQADLERERKLREAMNAQKNAERAAIRAHFRRKYQLMVVPEAAAKDDSFGLLSAFQSLSLSAGIFTGKQSQTPAPRTDTEPCRVM